ncbi:MAG: twin-arginine translocase TatA/TatE family subunit [Actinobacteria bacterium]|nr:twin-arginine translocase TatA/TatE family subunit [Actinomycetota bacterium]
MNLGPTELIIVLVIILVLFGGAKLPKLAKSLGEAKREFEKGSTEGAASDQQQQPGVNQSTDTPTDQQGPVS